MPQFGAGPALAAQCQVPPTPDGWRLWTDQDGLKPDVLAKRAQAMADDQNIPLGTTESYPLPGVTVLIRVEPHIWSRDAQNNFVQGCFRAAGIYLPILAPTGAGLNPPAATDSTLTYVVTALTAVSLTVGSIATLASLRSKK
jgi:hypothetical protein